MEISNFNVDVEPKVMDWIIRSSGYSVEKISKQCNLNTDSIKEWVEGKKKPTMNEIENLSKYLKRPLAAFLIPKPPEEKPLPVDYRMIHRDDGIFNPKTILAIRNTRRLQEISQELSENLNRNTAPLISFTKTSEDPKKIADEYRNKFQITEETQKKWVDSNEAFNYLKETIEKQNIFVFQFPMPTKDISGFTLPESTPSVITVNSKNQTKQKIFTIIHELGHILIKKPSADIPEKTLFLADGVNDVEKWCNEFASAFMLPEDIAKKVFDMNKDTLTEMGTLSRLSDDYKVSEVVLLYNMWKLGYVDGVRCKEILCGLRLRKDGGKLKTCKTSKRLLSSIKCINQKGRKFISLVSANVRYKFITDVDAFEYLSVKSQQYDRILQGVGE